MGDLNLIHEEVVADRRHAGPSASTPSSRPGVPRPSTTASVGTSTRPSGSSISSAAAVSPPQTQFTDTSRGQAVFNFGADPLEDAMDFSQDLQPEDDGEPDYNHNFQDWHDLMPALMQAYRHSSTFAPDSKPPSALSCACFRDSVNNSVSVYAYTLEARSVVHFSSCYSHMAELLLSNRLFPASPVQPKTVFSAPLLRWLEGLRKTSSVGAYNFALAARDVYEDDTADIEISTHLRKQLRSASSWYQTMRVHGYTSALHGSESWLHPRPMLADDHLHLTPEFLADICPACFYQFLDDAHRTSGPADSDDYTPPVEDVPPQLILSVDGNFTQKRKRREDRFRRQSLPPRRFLSSSQVQEAEQAINPPQGPATVTAVNHEHDCSTQLKAAVC
ncbi:hypothetical protein CF326_g9680 [Tilletia indica]|nr:hypothetical protein CF326_g9680 [Tilletia indica]